MFFFSIDSTNSIPRILKILLMILFILQSKKYIQKFQKEFEKIIFSFWSLVFFIVILDAILRLFLALILWGFQLL